MEGLNFTIDLGGMNEYIANTFANTIYGQVRTSVESLIKTEYADKIRELTRLEIEKQLVKQVEDFMNGTITVGGGWNAPKRELTREQYLSETIEENLNKNFDGEKLKGIVTSDIKTQIEKFSTSVKKDINSSISQLFTAATKATLTDNVVQMLMDNDTYKKLSNSMQNLIGD
jgi:citrate lyase gamma subunit